MDTSKNTQKAIFSKSHSSNSEDYNKPISTHSTLKKQTSITKTNKLNPHKLINTVDWEDEKKELNYEKKSPELKNKLSDDFKSVSTEKEHTSLNNNTDFNINNNNNSSEKNVDDSSKFRLKTQTNSISTVELKEKEIKSSLENDNPMLTEEKSDEKCQRTTSPKEKSLNLNNSEEKMKRNECEIISPKSHKISSEINETKRNNADDSEINIYGQFNFCNELEIKIIKNMLNETNQRSRFSFVQHSERKSGKDIQENSLKEILLSSLKLNEFKRSSSLNFYELLDSSEKKASYYSHDVNGTEKMGANLFNAYSNLENNLKTHKSSPYDYNDNNDDFNESSVTKKI